MGNTFSCVSGKAADDSPKKSKGSRPLAGIPLPPSKPRVVTETEDTITISWDKPTYDGGNAIFGYAVKMGRDGQSGWRKLTAECEVCTFKAKDLEPDTYYKFFVQAENDNGLSKPSEISDQIKTLPLKLDIPPVSAEIESTVDIAKADENENEDKKEAVGVVELSATAEKYVVKDEEEKSRKSSSSSSSSSEGGESLSLDVEVEEEESAVEVKEAVTTEVKTITMETTVITMVTGETKVESSSESKSSEMTVTMVTKSDSKESVKSGSSSSSSSDDEKKSNKSAEETKNDIAKAASAGVSVEADFSANGSSVGHGTGVLSSFLDSRLYQYSNDSLLDEENEEDAEVKNKNRVNKNLDIQTHDKRYFIEIETVDGGNLEDEVEPPYDEHDHYIHTQIPPMVPVEFECDQSNRLSIISEKSMEDNLSPCSPDMKAKDGQHFVFGKKEVVVTGSKSEASVSKIPMIGSKIPSRMQEPVIINPISAEITPPKSKIPPPQVKASVTAKPAQEQVSKLPTLGSSFGMKVESEERSSPREETKRQTSIPSLSSSAKVETKIAQPSSIPRRGSGPKTSIPLKRDNSGDDINVKLSASTSSSEEGEETKISTGIPRRKSIEKPEPSRITPPSTRIATGIPRGASGIRPPGSFGFQARVDASS